MAKEKRKSTQKESPKAPVRTQPGKEAESETRLLQSSRPHERLSAKREECAQKMKSVCRRSRRSEEPTPGGLGGGPTAPLGRALGTAGLGRRPLVAPPGDQGGGGPIKGCTIGATQLCGAQTQRRPSRRGRSRQSEEPRPDNGLHSGRDPMPERWEAAWASGADSSKNWLSSLSGSIGRLGG